MFLGLAWAAVCGALEFTSGAPGSMQTETEPRSLAGIWLEKPMGVVTVDAKQIEGMARHEHRSSLGGHALIIDLKSTPYSPLRLSNNSPPPVEQLRDKPMDQAAFDELAEPGQFVTPPAATRRHHF